MDSNLKSEIWPRLYLWIKGWLVFSLICWFAKTQLRLHLTHICCIILQHHQQITQLVCLAAQTNTKTYDKIKPLEGKKLNFILSKKNRHFMSYTRIQSSWRQFRRAKTPTQCFSAVDSSKRQTSPEHRSRSSELHVVLKSSEDGTNWWSVSGSGCG